jgi:hypothetical protein
MYTEYVIPWALILFSSEEKQMRKSGLVIAIGIGCSTKTIHTVMHDVRTIVLDLVQVLQRRFWPRKWSREEIFRIKIGCVSLSLSLHKQRK